MYQTAILQWQTGTAGYLYRAIPLILMIVLVILFLKFGLTAFEVIQ